VAPSHALALVRVQAKRWQGYMQAGLLSREIGLTPGCRRCPKSGRQHRRQRYREPPADPARSKNPCMRGVSMRENREVPRSPARLITGGPLREGHGCTPEMNERGKSDSPVLSAFKVRRPRGARQHDRRALREPLCALGPSGPALERGPLVVTEHELDFGPAPLRHDCLPSSLMEGHNVARGGKFPYRYEFLNRDTGINLLVF